MSNEAETLNSDTPPSETANTEETSQPETSSSEETETKNEPAASEEPRSLLDDEEGSGEDSRPEFDHESLTDETFAAALPEGFNVDPELSGPFMEELNAASSRAEMLKVAMKHHVTAVDSLVSEAANEFNSTVETWQTELQNDPVLGGDNQGRVLGGIKEMFKTYDSKGEALELFKLSGLGNNPSVLRMLNSIKQDLPGEATPVSGKDAAAETKTLADRFMSEIK